MDSERPRQHSAVWKGLMVGHDMDADAGNARRHAQGQR